MCVVGHGGFFGVRNFLNHFSFWLILMNCQLTANLSYDRQVVKHTLRYARLSAQERERLQDLLPLFDTVSALMSDKQSGGTPKKSPSQLNAELRQ